MRVALAVGLLLLAPLQAAQRVRPILPPGEDTMSTAPIAETTNGRYELRSNEATLVDKTGADPVAWNGISNNKLIVKWSVNIPGPNGKIELGYILGKRDERPGHEDSAEFEFWFKQPGAPTIDRAYEKTLGIRHDGMVIYKGSVTTTPLPRRIALRSLSNGRLVCAESNGDAPLIANRDQVGPWETFEVIEVP